MEEEHEPLRPLSRAEFEARRAEIRAANARARTPQKREGPQANGQMETPAASAPESAPQSENMSSPTEHPAPPSAQVMEVGSRIWEMRKRGLSVYEIHRREGIPMEAVKEILANFEQCFYPSVGEAI